ncbi:hemerythrin domain-containing protein [Streptacidiphilus rugosus]|uniref:hemerythrin domain-containing protein n=1 Tax=Streptacidiphilus rugosus TaxID=405783 RepID=UPI000560DBE5|nr:hemerythrin domain-containing protein [Streptacidiphilus rugosus]
MGHGADIIEVLKADHRGVQAMFDKINALAPGDVRRREIADTFTIELVRHAVAEERYLYPAVRAHIPGGDAIADQEIADHAAVEELLTRLEVVDADRYQFDALVSSVISEVVAHVADEEIRLFPVLAHACTPGQLNELGANVRSARDEAPAGPHPAAPSATPMGRLLAPGTGLVARVRDLLTGRGRT